MGDRESQSDDPLFCLPAARSAPTPPQPDAAGSQGTVLGLDFPDGYWETVADEQPSSPVVGTSLRVTHERPPPDRSLVPAGAWWWAAGAGFVLALLSAPTVLGIAAARQNVATAARAAEQGLAALAAGEHDAAVLAFDRARLSLQAAEDRLTGRGTPIGLAIPLLSQNLRASRTLVSVGLQLSVAGADVARASEDPVEARRGRMPTERIRTMTPSLENAERVLVSARAELRGVVGSPLVAAPLRNAARTVDGRLARQGGGVARAVAALRLLPEMLGAEGPRRYFVAFQNNAEMRGTGGLIGNWGELLAESGTLRLERFGRAEELIRDGGEARVRYLSQGFLTRWNGFHVDRAWQQVNASPDFPTVGRMISDLYPQSGGRPLDGVIGVDVPGLAGLLTLTGPVDDPAWPVPVTAENLVHVVLHEAYDRFPDRGEREAFLDGLTRRVWTAVTSGDIGHLGRMVQTLGRSVREGHLAFYMQREKEQDVMSLLGASGAVPKVAGDSIMLVNQNLAANKVDSFLERRLRYDIRLQPDGDSAAVSGKLQVGLANRAPPSGLADAVLGPYDERFSAGENRTYLSVYSPLRATGAFVDGSTPVALDSQRDLGRQAHSTVLSLLAQQSRSMVLDLNGRVDLRRGWYVLDVIRQPTVTPDDVAISVVVPPGWRISEARGLVLRGPREASGTVPTVRDHAVQLRINRVDSAGLPQRVANRVRDWLGRGHPAGCIRRSRSWQEADC